MKTTSIVVLLLFLAGCANYQPIVDTKGVDMNRYHVDLGECQQFAGGVDPGENAAAGAVAGAVLGGVLGAIFGNRQAVGQMAAAGGVLGGTQGAAGGATAQREIVKRCMAGRGYRVLY